MGCGRTLHTIILLNGLGLIKSLLVGVVPDGNVCSSLSKSVCNRETNSGASTRDNGSASLKGEEWENTVSVLWCNGVVNVEDSVLVHSTIVEGSLSRHDC